MFLGSILVLLSGFLYGLAPLVTVYLYGSGLNTFTVSFFRYAFSLVVVILIALIKRKRLLLPFKEALGIIKHLALWMIATTLLLSASYRFIATGTATSLHFMYPVFVILICLFYYREKLSKTITLALIMVLVGLFCFLQGLSFSGLSGIVMAIASALTYAIYILNLERHRLNRLDPLALSFYQGIYTIVALYLLSFLIEPINFRLGYIETGLLIIFSIISLVASILFQLGSCHLGAKLSALLSLSEPLTSMVVGILFLSEGIMLNKMIGSLFILGAIILVTFKK